MSEPSKRRNWGLILRVSAILLIVGSVGTVAIACTLERPYIMGFEVDPWTASQRPEISLEDARELVKFPIPQLPAVSLRECNREETTISLLGVQANWKEVLLSYSHGLWLRVAKPSVAGLVGADLGPGSKSVGSVRGAAADITGPGVDRRFFFCRRGSGCSHFLTTGSGGRWYSQSPQLHWVENGLHFFLQGPYNADVLKDLAEQITFLPK